MKSIIATYPRFYSPWKGMKGCVETSHGHFLRNQAWSPCATKKVPEMTRALRENDTIQVQTVG
jgi:hypothetical protein